ncbi:R-spondin-2-like [Acipenser ruthenus]|uniref:R-spondin-2-like n=1 Tax=Acipenser ruthenus TaxID=7906 RepID=UPI002741A4BA|nr:R-spondin-2-like [Acipenser ruthenus]
MHLRLSAVVFLVNCAFMLSQQTSRTWIVSSDLPEDCKGCLECSGDNGCLKCPEKLFLFIQREGMRQHGSCVQSCPPGHYGVRGQHINRCTKCKTPDCENCFSKDFCMRCKAGFHLFKGKCLSSCPDGTSPHLTDCIEGCEAGQWSEWTACTNNGHLCGYRWGTQSRSKETIRKEAEETASCPALSETKRCRMKKRCAGEKRPVNKKKGKKQRNGGVTEPPGQP